jgi:hypothetical protein
VVFITSHTALPLTKNGEKTVQKNLTELFFSITINKIKVRGMPGERAFYL